MEHSWKINAVDNKGLIDQLVDFNIVKGERRRRNSTLLDTRLQWFSTSSTPYLGHDPSDARVEAALRSIDRGNFALSDPYLDAPSPIGSIPHFFSCICASVSTMVAICCLIRFRRDPLGSPHACLRIGAFEDQACARVNATFQQLMSGDSNLKRTTYTYIRAHHCYRANVMDVGSGSG
jgi:hypothetical protein